MAHPTMTIVYGGEQFHYNIATGEVDDGSEVMFNAPRWMNSTTANLVVGAFLTGYRRRRAELKRELEDDLIKAINNKTDGWFYDK